MQVADEVESQNITAKKLATKSGIDKDRLLEWFNEDPTSMRIEDVIKIVNALGIKVAVVAYKDNDPKNEKGLIHSVIFDKCWKKCNKPKDAFEI